MGPKSNSLWLVRIISNLCPYMARLTPYVFNCLATHSRKPQLNMHKIGKFFIYYEKFINRKVVLTLFLLNTCENFTLLWLQPISGAISFQLQWRKSSIHSESQCKLKLARVWRVLIYYTVTSHGDVRKRSVSWLVKMKERRSLKFQ